MIKELLKLSNHLDAKGLRKEADYLDAVLQKLAEDSPKLPALQIEPHGWGRRGRRRSGLEAEGKRVLEFLLFVDKTVDSQRNENIAKSLRHLKGDTFQQDLIKQWTGRLIENVRVDTSWLTPGRAATKEDRGVPVYIYLGPLAGGEEDPLGAPVNRMALVRQALESAFEQKLGGVGLTLREREWARGTVSKPVVPQGQPAPEAAPAPAEEAAPEAAPAPAEEVEQTIDRS